MSSEPLPADIMEWMGMDESMVEFVLDIDEAPPFNKVRRTRRESRSA